jgi:cobalt/nickel transport system ATP-binding protein
MTVIEARDLQYAYPDGTTAVEGIDLTIEAGERLALLGPNGAGKSTLLLLLGGLLDPDGGRVRYFDADEDADAVRDRLGVLTQNPDDYLFNPTVREDLEYGPAQLDVPHSVAAERVDHLAERLALTPLLEKPPFRLSGGEKQRAALASALAVDPDVLLLDEPVSEVDATNRDRLFAFLDHLHADGTTLVVSTPNPDVVARVADRVVLLDENGVIVRDGPVDEVLTDVETLRECHLAPPTVVDLFDRAGWETPPVTTEDALAVLRALREGDPPASIRDCQ